MKKDTNEIESKKKQLVRLIISFNDFKNAFDIADLIIEENYQTKLEKSQGKEKQTYRKVWESLNCAMVVGYNRPFSGNDKKNKNPIPDLPTGVTKIFGKKEKEIHASLINNRNKFIAHSDSEAIDIELYYIKVEDTKLDLLIPLQNPTRAPYLIENVIIIKAMCKKLMEEIFRRRKLIEKELKDYIPIKELGKDEFEFPFYQT